nr:hypothetical protein [Vibrio parahaemolyticus]
MLNPWLDSTLLGSPLYQWIVPLGALAIVFLITISVYKNKND